MRSHLFALSSTSGVGLKETPSVRCYGDCAPAKESEREREKASNLFNLAQWKERILQGSWSGNEAQQAQISAQLANFSLTDGFQKFKEL